MAITSYQKKGKTLFKAYVNERSKVDPKIRVQGSKSGFETEAEARREEKKLIKLVIEKIAAIESKGITWQELVLRWEMCAINNMAGKKYSRPVINEHVSTLYKHTHAWFKKRVRDLGRADGRYMINALTSESYSLSRMKGIKGSINKVWTWGVEEGLISDCNKSPVHGLVMESEKNKYKPILTLNEVKKLMYEAQLRDHPWSYTWAVALLTGMRSGELYALTWDDVDFENNIIRITKSYSPRIKSVKSTKNCEWRNAHISEDLKEVLIKLKNEFSDSLYVLPRTGGWSDFKTFQIYIRMAGVDVKGVTDGFKVTPKLGMLSNVIKIK